MSIKCNLSSCRNYFLAIAVPTATTSAVLLAGISSKVAAKAAECLNMPQEAEFFEEWSDYAFSTGFEYDQKFRVFEASTMVCLIGVIDSVVQCSRRQIDPDQVVCNLAVSTFTWFVPTMIFMISRGLH